MNTTPVNLTRARISILIDALYEHAYYEEKRRDAAISDGYPAQAANRTDYIKAIVELHDALSVVREEFYSETEPDVMTHFEAFDKK